MYEKNIHKIEKLNFFREITSYANMKKRGKFVKLKFIFIFTQTMYTLTRQIEL